MTRNAGVRARQSFQHENRTMRSRVTLLLLLGVIAVPVYWIGSSFWQAQRFNAAERAAQERYKSEYQRWLATAPDALIAELIRVRGEPFSQHGPIASVPLDNASAIGDATLQLLLKAPGQLDQLELLAPRSLRSNVDVHQLLGKWRFGERDDALRPEAIEPNATADRRRSEGRLIPSAALTDALVLREGTSAGDWLFYLPKSGDCPWLYLRDNGEYCAPSLKSWLAASVVGAGSGWARVDMDEAAIVSEFRTLEKMGPAAAIADVISFDPGPWSIAPKLEGKRRVPASPDWPDVVAQLGDGRPPAVLTPEQTYRADRGYSQYAAQVRLWDGERMRSVRLRPQDFDDAVVVLAEPFGGDRVVQLHRPDGIVYVDLEMRCAFRNFSSWVDWARAAERVWRRQGRAFGPNAARFPIG